MVVTLRTIRSNTESFYIVHMLHIYVVYDSQKKQRLLLYAALLDWFRTTEADSVYCPVRTDSLHET